MSTVHGEATKTHVMSHRDTQDDFTETHDMFSPIPAIETTQTH